MAFRTSVIHIWITLSHTHAHTQNLISLPTSTVRCFSTFLYVCFPSSLKILILCLSSRFHQPQCDTSQWHDTFSRLSQFVTVILWQTHTHTETPQWDCVVPDTWRSAALQNSLHGSQTQEFGWYISTVCIKLCSHTFGQALQWQICTHTRTYSQRYLSRIPISWMCQ